MLSSEKKLTLADAAKEAPDPASPNRGLTLDEIAAAVAAERARVETELVAAILSDPARGVALAEQNGIAAEVFEQEDLQTIFLAAVVKRLRGQLGNGRRNDQLAVMRLASLALCGGRMWDPAGPIALGPLWNNESLVLLATREPSPASVPMRARRLIDVHRRCRDARDHLSYARQRLLGALNESIAI
jgi:hypothetical protein